MSAESCLTFWNEDYHRLFQSYIDETNDLCTDLKYFLGFEIHLSCCGSYYDVVWIVMVAWS